MSAGFEFPPSVVEEAFFSVAKGHCQCVRVTHGPPKRCGKQLTWANRGRGSGRGEWEANHRNRKLPGWLSNCEILCVSCHIGTRTFGKRLKLHG